MKCFVALITFFLMIFVAVQAVDKSVCALPKETGPCRKADPSYFYNNEAMECQEFIYGGCHGNDNRFPSQEECEETCM